MRYHPEFKRNGELARLCVNSSSDSVLRRTDDGTNGWGQMIWVVCVVRCGVLRVCIFAVAGVGATQRADLVNLLMVPQSRVYHPCNNNTIIILLSVSGAFRSQFRWVFECVFVSLVFAPVLVILLVYRICVI